MQPYWDYYGKHQCLPWYLDDGLSCGFECDWAQFVKVGSDSESVALLNMVMMNMDVIRRYLLMGISTRDKSTMKQLMDSVYRLCCLLYCLLVHAMERLYDVEQIVGRLCVIVWICVVFVMDWCGLLGSVLFCHILSLCGVKIY